jgi:hypothetical protein
MKKAVPIILIITFLKSGTVAQPSKSVGTGPYEKERIIKILRLKALPMWRIVEFVVVRGVNFEITPDVQQELSRAGATTGLIEIMGASYRASDVERIRGSDFEEGTYMPSDPSFIPPFSYSEVKGLISSGVSLKGFSTLIKTYGVGFSLIPELVGEITKVGGKEEHIALIRANIKGGSSVFSDYQRHSFQSKSPSRISNLSVKHFDELKPGLTYIEAVRLLGEEGTRAEYYEEGGYTFSFYDWRLYGLESGLASVAFRNGRLLYKFAMVSRQ